MLYISFYDSNDSKIYSVYEVSNTGSDTYKELLSLIESKKDENVYSVHCKYNITKDRDITFPILCKRNVIILLRPLFFRFAHTVILKIETNEDAEIILTSSNNKPLLNLRIESSHKVSLNLSVHKCIISNMEISDQVEIECFKYFVSKWEQLKHFIETNKSNGRCKFIDTVFISPAEYAGFQLKHPPKIRFRIIGKFGLMNITSSALDYWDIILNGHVTKGVLKRDSNFALLKANPNAVNTLTMFYIMDRPTLYPMIRLMRRLEKSGKGEGSKKSEES